MCIQLLLFMSKSQSEIESQQSIRRKDLIYQSSSSNTSSEDDESYKTHELNVKVTSKMNDAIRQTSNIRNFQQQIFELKKQNIELRDENFKLLELVKDNRQDKNLKKQLKEKEKEINELKRQISQNQYYQSSKSSRIQTVIPVQIEDRKYRLRTKSIKSKHKQRQSVSSDESESVKLRTFDHTSEINKLKTQKLTLQKYFYQLQEKILILQHEAKWMKNLAIKVINFAQKLSFVFKQEIFHSNWDLLKKAKSSWRYLKHIIKFVLQTN